MKHRIAAAALLMCGMLGLFSPDVSAATGANDYRSVYTAKLKKELSSNAKNKMFSIYDLDADGTPELLISGSTESGSKCSIYTCSSGKLKELGSYGDYGVVNFIPEASVIHDLKISEDRGTTTFYKYSKGKMDKVLVGVEKMDLETGDMSYTINNSSVSMSVYTAKLDTYLTKQLIFLGRNFPLTNQMIGFTLSGGTNYKAAYKALLNARRSDDPFHQTFTLKDVTGNGTPELIINYTDVYSFDDGTLRSLSIISITYPNFEKDFTTSDKATYKVSFNRSKNYIVIEYKVGDSRYYQYMKAGKDKVNTIASFADIADGGEHTYKVNGNKVKESVYNSKIKSYKSLTLESFGKEYTLAPAEINEALQ